MQTLIIDHVTGKCVRRKTKNTSEVRVIARVMQALEMVTLCTDDVLVVNGKVVSSRSWAWDGKQWLFMVKVSECRRYIPLSALQQMGAAASYLGIDSIEVLS